MSVSYDLPPSRVHAHRLYLLVPIESEWADAYLTIQQGVRGPRGRLPDVESYFVQVESEWADPESPWRGLFVSLLLVKDREPAGGFGFDRSDDSAEPYRVFLSLVRREVAWCTCKGYRCHKLCKHVDALSHAVRVCGFGAFHGAAMAASL